ncbi:MAG: glycosyltransferase family 4 protein, partial [Clostridia bacterium]
MNKNNKKKYKIAILGLAPFHYHIPLYQKISDSKQIDLRVYYCSDLKGEILLTDKEEILRDYNYKFVKNYSPFPFLLGKWFGAINFEICKEIKKNKYDAIIFQHWDKVTSWLAFLTCLFYKIPILFMTDTNSLSNESKSKWKLLLKRFIFSKILFKRASGFLTSGIANKEFYKKYKVSPEKLINFHYSFGYEWFLKKAKNLIFCREENRKEFGIKDDDFVILYVGRLSEEKDIFTLLNAYKDVKYKSKKLFLIGAGPLDCELKEYVKLLGIEGVFFVGFQHRETILKFYYASNVLVLPSINETWGNVVNEAMCLSLPIIASDKVGAVADLVKDGYNGFIFPSGNAEKLSICIDKLINLSLEQRNN